VRAWLLAGSMSSKWLRPADLRSHGGQGDGSEGLYIGARPDLSPNPIDQYLGLQLGLHFAKFGSTIGSQNIKPLYPSVDPI
jgi:hypothetical protein